MTLDGHSYLVSHGWGGKGTGLRHGAITRPIAIAQKKNLAGLGKDRDEAFPFWDHLFSAAASSIQVKITSDSDDDTSSNENDRDDINASNRTSITFKRTVTGIISHRRPVEGTPATSGTSTPSLIDAPSSRYSLLVTAKRESARRGLYARFFRGPVLGPDTTFERRIAESSPDPEYPAEMECSTIQIGVITEEEMPSLGLKVEDDVKSKKSSKKRRKSESEATPEDTAEGEERETKRRRKEEKSEEKAKRAQRKEEKRRAKEEVKAKRDKKNPKGSEEVVDQVGELDQTERRRSKKEKKAATGKLPQTDEVDGGDIEIDKKKEKLQRKEERRRRKAEKTAVASTTPQDVSITRDTPLDTAEGTKHTSVDIEDDQKPKKKKKRKHSTIS